MVKLGFTACAPESGIVQMFVRDALHLSVVVLHRAVLGYV